MMHRAWSSIAEVPYCFSRSYFEFQGHTARKIVEFDPNWAFPDCSFSLNSPMAMKCCTKLETAKERCPIVFKGHPSNFKVTRYKTSPILTQIGHFRTIGRSQLSNPSDLPCWKANILNVELSMIKIDELLRKLWSLRSCFLILPPGALTPQGIEGAMKRDVSKHWCTLQWCASRGWFIAHENWTSCHGQMAPISITEPKISLVQVMACHLFSESEPKTTYSRLTHRNKCQ